MKIVFDSLVFALHKYGGVTTYWNEFIGRFKKEHDVSVLMVPPAKYLSGEFVEISRTGINPIPEKEWPLQVLRNTSPAIPSIREKFIFHSNYLRVSGNRNAVNIVTIHDFTHQYFGQGIKKLLNYYQKKKAISGADGIVCISNNTLKDLHHFFPESRRKPVSVIYNGCSNVYLDATIAEPIVQSSKPYLLFVGARGTYKNFDFVLKLLQSTSYHVVVAGSQFTPEETQLISPFSDRITLLNNISDQKLKALYQHAYAFVYPSLYEGFGIPLLEAMNSRCPVIAFNNSCIPEIMGNSPLLLENNDLKAATDALAKLEDESFRQQIIELQQNQARKFSWGRAYDEMKAFYKECLKQ